MSSGNTPTFWACVLSRKLMSEIIRPGPISWMSSSPSTVEGTEYAEAFWIWNQQSVTSAVFRRGRFPSFLMGLWGRWRWSSCVTWVFTEALVMLSHWPVPGLLCVNCEWVNTFVKCFSIPTEMSGWACFCGLGQSPPDSCPSDSAQSPVQCLCLTSGVLFIRPSPSVHES